MASRRTRRALSRWLHGLAIVLLSLIASPALAGLALDGVVQDARGTRFRLVYTPADSPGSDALHLPPDVQGLAPARPREADRGRCSTLLPVPAGMADPSLWTVVGAPSGEVVRRRVTVGSFERLLVEFTPDSPAAAGTIELTGPALGMSVADVPMPADGFTGEPAPRPASKGVTRQPPAPPAPSRVVYTSGDRVLTIAAADLPAPTAARLIHHGTTLSFGGTIGANHWFYAPRRVTLTDETDSVFIDPAASSPSPVVATRPAFTSLAAGATQVAMERHRLFEPNLLYERSAPVELGNRFVAYRVFQGSSATTSLAITDALTTDNLRLNIRLLGLTTSGASPEHFATLTVDGETESLSLAWGGRTAIDGSLFLNPEPPGQTRGPKALPEPRTLTLRHAVPVSAIPSYSDVQNLERVEAVYTAYPRVSSGIGRIDLPAAASPRRITLGGFPAGTLPADMLLLDITNSAAPVRIMDPPVFADTTDTVAIEFEAPATACVFHAERIAALAAPLAIQAVPALPALPSGLLKGIYVRDPSLATALQPLLDLRGSSYIALDPAAAFCVYHGGQESPEAIRQALADLIDAAPATTAFPTILLVGHATFDPRNYLGFKSGAQVPTFVEESIDTGFTIENCIDAPYALLSGNDQLSDAAVGRLPVKTPAELTTIVNRILAHEALEETLTNTTRHAVIVNDDDPDVLADAALWPVYWQTIGRPYEEITIDELSNGSAEKALLKTSLETAPYGPAFVLYTGHGSTTLWADEKILQAIDLAGIDTSNRWPLVTTFTCLNGNYAVPNATVRTLGEEWLLTPGRGAIANIAPCSVDYYSNQRDFSLIFLDILSQPPGLRPDTAGELLTRARIEFTLQFPDRQATNNLFLLFGDPDTPLTLDSIPSRVGEWRLLEP